ncbi:MAG: subclass B3 metallo-beta-lactamase [Alphaproteobacteria bacterium]|nr:subclass B3 metallo-beta-lactamase [Alphaproteobacteria bacterium]
MLAAVIAAAALAAASPADHASACRGKDGWSDPAPPIRIFANAYNVGTCGIAAVLLTDPAGLVLIDAGPASAAPIVQRNIEALGYKITDVKLLLATHEHHDHVGGLAALQKASGATLRVSPAATPVLAGGIVDPNDPQFGLIEAPPAARVGPPLADGEVIRLGRIALTAHLTPGHSAGGTSWTWRACEGGRCRAIAYADSLSAVSRDGYRFLDHPERVEALNRSFDTVAGLKCDILVTPHPIASNLFARLHGEAPLVNGRACKTYAATARANLAKRLAEERAGRP